MKYLKTYNKKSLSARKDVNGYSQVLFYIQMAKIRLRIKSGVFVNRSYWNDETGNISIPKKIGDDLRRELSDTKEKLKISEERTFKIIDIKGETVTKQFIETALTLLKDYNGTITENVLNDVIADNSEKEGESQDKKFTLFEYAHIYMNAKQVSEGRKRHYLTGFRTMARYQLYCQAIKQNGFCWDIETTTKENICDFFNYMKNEHIYRENMPNIFKDVRKVFVEKPYREPRIEPRGEVRLITLKKMVKAFWNWLIEQGITKNYPFVGIKFGAEIYGTPFYLTLEERNLIAKAQMPTQHLEVQRDIFIFHCLVGCRVGDLVKFTKENIVNGILVYTPHKTKDHLNSLTARVPLNEMALSLIKKYEGVDRKGRLFPYIADQNYNIAIKEILTICEITRKVNVRNSLTGENEMRPINEVASSHMARRTFVGNAYKKVKDPNLIGRMSGHVEGSSAFVRYRDIDDDMLKDVINLIS